MQILNLRAQNQICGKLLFSPNLRLEGAVSHNILYYQTLPITRNQERFYDDNCLE